MNVLRIAVAVAVTVVWAAAYVLSFVDRTYSVPGSLTPVMLLVAGYLFGREIRDQIRKRGSGD